MKLFQKIKLFVFLVIAFISCKEATFVDSGIDYSYDIAIIDNYLSQANDNKQKSLKLKYIDSAKTLIRQLNNRKGDTLKRHKLIEVIKLYDRLQIRDSFYNSNVELRELSTELVDSVGLAYSSYNFGLHYFRVDNLDSAYAYFYDSEKLYDNLGPSIIAGRSALAMAITKKNVKDYVGSEESSIKAIEIFETIDDKRLLSSCYNNLGSISNRLENYDEAIKNYQTAIDYKKEEDKKSLIIAGHLNNIGNVYVDKKEYEKAISFFNEGLAYDSLLIKRPRTYARLLDNKAYAEYKMGIVGSFPEAFLEPLEIRKKIKYKRGIVNSNLRIATIYEELGNKENSELYAQRAYNMSKEIPYSEGMLEALDLFMKVKNPNYGVVYGQEYIRISDSLQRQERAFQNKFARIRFETKKLEVAKNKATERSRVLIIIFSISVIVFLIGYILLQRRNNRKELEYQEGQQKANEEIFNLMLAQQGKLEEGKHLAKQRISEELHDGILSRLFGLRLSLDSLNNKHGKDVETLRSSYIDQLKDLGQEIRKISHDLNNETFSQDTLYPDVLKKLLKDQFEAQEVTYDFLYDHTINWDLISNSKKVHVYRIIQECLMNINKHANAQHITVTFKSLHDNVQLTIEDDGVGMDTGKARSGIGMKNIKSRVAQIAGSYKIISKMNLGTQIQISFN